MNNPKFGVPSSQRRIFRIVLQEAAEKLQLVVYLVDPSGILTYSVVFGGLRSEQGLGTFSRNFSYSQSYKHFMVVILKLEIFVNF